MSARKKAKKSAGAGEIHFSQFASCVDNGLNIHAYDEKSNTEMTKIIPGYEGQPNAAGKKSCSPTEKKTRQSARKAKADSNGTTATATYPRVECTNGAMEALRLCHSAFLSQISTSLGELDSNISEKDVLTCMEQMGLSNLAKRATESLESDDAKQSSQKQKKKRKKSFGGFKGTQEELIAEQERMLAESARRVKEMQGKSEE